MNHKERLIFRNQFLEKINALPSKSMNKGLRLYSLPHIPSYSTAYAN